MDDKSVEPSRGTPGNLQSLADAMKHEIVCPVTGTVGSNPARYPWPLISGGREACATHGSISSD